MSTVQDQEDVPALVKCLKSSKPPVRLQALKALQRLNPTATAIPALTALLTDPHAAIRQEAARALVRVGPPALPAVLEALANSDKRVRREAAWALRRMGPTSSAALPTLVRALKDPDLRVRKGAALALGALEDDAQPAIPALIEALRDNQLVFCRLAASALAEIGLGAVAALTEALVSPDCYVRREAAWALGQIGADAWPAVPALLQALEASADDADPSARAHPTVDREKATDVVCIKPYKNLNEAQGSHVRRADKTFRAYVAQALGLIGADVDEVVPALRRALADPDTKVCRVAAEALALLEGRPAPAGGRGPSAETQTTPVDSR